MPARSTAALMAVLPSSTALIPLSVPPKFPMGVLATETIYTSFIMNILLFLMIIIMYFSLRR
jgi:hypothetical protein